MKITYLGLIALSFTIVSSQAAFSQAKDTWGGDVNAPIGGGGKGAVQTTGGVEAKKEAEYKRQRADHNVPPTNPKKDALRSTQGKSNDWGVQH